MMTTRQMLEALRIDIARLEEKLDLILLFVESPGNSNSADRLLTRYQAMRFMGIHSEKVFRRDVAGKIPSYPRTARNHRERMYDPDDLKALQQSWGGDDGLVEDMAEWRKQFD